MAAPIRSTPGIVKGLGPGLELGLADAVLGLDVLGRIAAAVLDLLHQCCETLGVPLHVLADLDGDVELAIDDVRGAGVLAVGEQLGAGLLGVATGESLEDFALGGLDAASDRIEQISQLDDLGGADGGESRLRNGLQLENGIAEFEGIGDRVGHWGRGGLVCHEVTPRCCRSHLFFASIY